MKYSNHMMPFLWVHGETEEVYREMIAAIDNSNIKSFCVESRPHNDFLMEKWWSDLSVIIDEAKKRGMTFYILDDKHFPSGYANGAIEKAPINLHRQSIFNKTIKVKKGESVSFNVMDECVLDPTYNELGRLMNMFMNNDKTVYDDDSLYSITAFRGNNYEPLDSLIIDGHLEYAALEDTEISLCFLTRNAGIHRNYINMMSKVSVRCFIDEVYEKHYEHFGDEFGKTIVGFFSDEPELGNSTYTNSKVDLGDDPNLDLPYSDELDLLLRERLGDGYRNLIPLLWKNDFDNDTISKVRYEFMRSVTDLVSICFSKQIGDWCRSHNVNYIGHVIEDNNLHSKTGTSLGHYFKGLKYQSMSGIDDIGGQVEPFKEDDIEDLNRITHRDGVFYHYTLAKLASSMSRINPIQEGRAMCEIFGNYGWEEGVRKERYLLDHFMVRGVNNFVPHAFTCAPYPDSDCPPHFYAHGHNPQYRHFGKLMEYGNRVSSMISSGSSDISVMVLYHADMEWCGKAMLNQEIGKVLYDNHIDFDIVPSDCFEDKEFYHTEYGREFSINSHRYKVLLIGECERIPDSIYKSIPDLLSSNVRVMFINNLPYGTCGGEKIELSTTGVEVVRLEELKDKLAEYSLLAFENPSEKIRVMHYTGEEDFYYLFNESKYEYSGKVTVPCGGDLVLYDAFGNKFYKANSELQNGVTTIDLSLESLKSIFIMKRKEENAIDSLKIDTKEEISGFETSISDSINYPDFKKGEVPKLFSGIARYERRISVKNEKRAFLLISDAYEGVEVFIEGQSLGIQITPSFVYDISEYMGMDDIKLSIEVSTTLEAERKDDLKMEEQLFGIKKEMKECLQGRLETVYIAYERKEKHD